MGESRYDAAIEEISIPFEGSRMPGLIYTASGAGPHPTVVLLHGIPGNEKNLDIAQAIRRDGFNVLFFHYRGAWGAEGDYAISQLVDDVGAALAFLRQADNAKQYRVDTEHLSVLGHSLGGWAALAAGHEDSGLVCVGAMAPANVGEWKLSFEKNDATARRLTQYADSLYMLNGFDGAAMRRQLESASLVSLDAREYGRGLQGKSVFMIVGDRDDVTTEERMFTPVVKAYEQVADLPLEHHVITGDHSFSWSRLELIQRVLNWLNRDCR
ncbi:MAG: alpha/beta fold hydrolase [Pseudomonadota bacterium]